MNKKAPKWRKIQVHLETHGSITGRIAYFHYGVYRLSSIIHRMRIGQYDCNFDIETKMEKDGSGSSFAKYILKESTPK